MAVDYNALKANIVAFLVANLSWATATNSFDYSPTSPAVVFDDLPALLLDFDLRASITYLPIDQGYEEVIPFLIEVYEEVASGDTTSGRASEVSITNKLKGLRDLLAGNPSIGGAVETSAFRGGKVEPISIEAKDIGIVSRLAWLAISVHAL
jgi:hypothetical protein